MCLTSLPTPYVTCTTGMHQLKTAVSIFRVENKMEATHASKPFVQ